VIAMLALLLCLIGWSQVSPAVTFVAASGRTALGSSSASDANIVLKRDTRITPDGVIDLVPASSSLEPAAPNGLADAPGLPIHRLECHRSPLGSRPPPASLFL
jgi:hypothetical protein